MDLYAVLDQVVDLVRQRKRITYRLLQRQFALDEATLEDRDVYTKPWKISFPLYRHQEKYARLLSFKCVEFAEELIYGQYKKK